MHLAPVILFVYNRPDILKHTLYALKNNLLIEQTELYVFADGPKSTASAQDLENIKQVRAIIEGIDWVKKKHINYESKNKGLSNSIIHGISEVLTHHDQIIVLEDDIVTSPYFLRYMNSTLEIYKGDEDVACISGYVYPVTSPLPKSFFIRGADCWGWATWKRAWKEFEPNATSLLERIKSNKMESVFDFDNSFPFTSMLEDQIKGNVNSWAIRWHASAFLKNRLTLYPGKSLVKNIGLDNSGTHGGNKEFYETEVSLSDIQIKKILLRESESGKQSFINYFNGSKKPQKSLKQLLKKITPPIILTLLAKNTPSTYLFNGNYINWHEAQKKSTGYDADNIINKVKTSLLKVKNKEALFERDSVLFHTPDYSWPLLSGLLLIKSYSQNKLNIIDFGGSLGSTYYQYKDFIKSDSLSWNIVEQEKFVKTGKDFFQDENLRFFNDMKEAKEKSNASNILISSTIQYLENPKDFIQELMKYNFQYILVDKTPCINSYTRLTVQKVQKEIYEASYPAWLFEYDELINQFADKYQLITEFESFQNLKITLEDNTQVRYRGFLLKLKS